MGRFSAFSAILTSKSAPKTLEIILVVVIALILARLCITLFAPLPLPQGDVVASAPSAAPVVAAAAKSPFPAVAVEFEPVEEEPSEAVAETTLDLTLTGASTWEEGSATIRTPDGQQKRFAVGDRIVSGVTLAAVYPNQVIIERNGLRESLRFESKVTADELPDSVQEPIRSDDAPAPGGDVSKADLGNLASVLRLSPGMNANGELVIELYAAQDRSSFSALGLEEGDLLVSVNGAPAPTNPAALSAVLSEIQQADVAAIVVERNGQRVPLRISLPDLFGE